MKDIMSGWDAMSITAATALTVENNQNTDSTIQSPTPASTSSLSASCPKQPTDM